MENRLQLGNVMLSLPVNSDEWNEYLAKPQVYAEILRFCKRKLRKNQAIDQRNQLIVMLLPYFDDEHARTLLKYIDSGRHGYVDKDAEMRRKLAMKTQLYLGLCERSQLNSAKDVEWDLEQLLDEVTRSFSRQLRKVCRCKPGRIHDLCVGFLADVDYLPKRGFDEGVPFDKLSSPALTPVIKMMEDRLSSEIIYVKSEDVLRTAMMLEPEEAYRFARRHFLRMGRDERLRVFQSDMARDLTTPWLEWLFKEMGKRDGSMLVVLQDSRRA